MAAGVWALSSGFCQETVTKRRDTSTAFSSLGDAGSLCRSDLSAPAGSAAACGDRVVGRGVSGVGARVKAVGQGVKAKVVGVTVASVGEMLGALENRRKVAEEGGNQKKRNHHKVFF